MYCNMSENKEDRNLLVLSDLLHFGERIQMETKLAKNEVPKALWETYSSFCNALGGYILLGVAENKEATSPVERYSVVGVHSAEKIITDFWNTIHSEKVNRNLLRDEDVKAIEYDGKTIICIHVPQAEYRDKPVFINGNPYKGTFKRTYEGDFHCTEKEVNDMIRDASDDGNDGALIEHYDMNDIDAPTLRAYRNLFMQRNPDHVWNTDTYTINSSFILSNDRKENDRKETKADIRRKRIIDAIKINNKITAPKIAQVLGCAEVTIIRDITYLREKGCVIRVGSPKYGYWKILKELE